MHFLQKYRNNYIAWVLAFLAALTIIFVILWKVIPAPPKKIVLATGGTSGLYYAFGEKLKAELAKEGVVVEVKSTAGTVENLALLNDPKSGVDFAIIQGGVADVERYPEFVSLAGLFYEPVWVWYRTDSFKEGVPLTNFSQLRGKKVAIGSKGSGTLSMSQKLLQASGLEENAIGAEYLSTDDAQLKLNSRRLDAVVTVSSSEAPVLQDFFYEPGIRLMRMEHAEAFSRIFPFLTKLTVPRGLLSVEFDRPRENVDLIAPTAALVTKSNVSPAIVSLILDHTYDILKSYSRLQKPGEFPSQTGLDFPMQSDAENYLNDGPSFLHRHLPYWTAVWVGRLAKILIPLLAILIPLFSYVPTLQNFRLKLKLSRIYTQLKVLEQNALDPSRFEQNTLDLSKIQKQADDLKIPTLETKELYDLKGHIGEVKERIQQIHSSFSEGKK